MKVIRTGDTVMCLACNLKGSFIVDKVEYRKGKDGESRLLVHSTDEEYSGQNPVYVTERSCTILALE